MNQLVFCGRTFLITGAGRGLGLAYARAVGQLGETVLLHDLGGNNEGTGTEPAIAENAAASLSLEGITAHHFHTPINKRDDCHKLVRECLAVKGRLDVVIHNAGSVGYERDRGFSGCHLRPHDDGHGESTALDCSSRMAQHA